MREQHLGPCPAGLLQPELGPAVHPHGHIGPPIAVEIGDHDVLDVFGAVPDEVLNEIGTAAEILAPDGDAGAIVGQALCPAA